MFDAFGFKLDHVQNFSDRGVLQDLDPEVLVTASAGLGNTRIAASLAVDEQQVNALLLDVVS